MAAAVTALDYRLRHGLEGTFELSFYVPWTILSGLAFFSMGGSYWGWCYALGCAFFALAVVMARTLDLAPLEFGGLWTVALAAIGLHLRRLGAADRVRKPQSPP
jgi:hypothetical protein